MTTNSHDPPTLDEVRGKLWEKYQQLMDENAVLRGHLTGLMEGLELCDPAGFAGTIKGIRNVLKEDGNAR